MNILVVFTRPRRCVYVIMTINTDFSVFVGYLSQRFVFREGEAELLCSAHCRLRVLRRILGGLRKTR